jgi:transposase
VNPDESIAQGIVLLLNELFAVDGEAREQGLDGTARDILRQQRSRPLLESIRKKIEAAQSQALPASKLGVAAAYTLGLWERLTRFLHYPELELSTNLAENSMRPVALGRKNWIHDGSPEAGPKVAAILSVVETCRRLHISLRKYLGAVLPGLADVSIQRMPDLTPAAWATANKTS